MRDAVFQLDEQRMVSLRLEERERLVERGEALGLCKLAQQARRLGHAVRFAIRDEAEGRKRSFRWK
eukprot:scaffold100410_cov23-Tisochrysis_lutea.AAC.1